MKVIKKYTAIKIETRQVDDTKEVMLSYNYRGYMKTIIKEWFDTEEEAMEEAYNNDKYATWLILPRISFGN